jgi:hypothetical protein
LRNSCPAYYKKSSKTPNRHDQNRTSPWHIILKTLSTGNKERILKAARQKCEIAYKGKLIRITADFSKETLKARKTWNEIFQALKENNCKPRLLYSAKPS